jgi:hypothetical protein
MGFHLAQVNVARPSGPMDAPAMADFAALLDPVNALAEASPGFVWRLQDESGNATAIRPFDDERIMINMSVWTSIDLLWNFVYETVHLEVLRRRREWFEHFGETYQALWWIEAGTLPSFGDARERLDHLEGKGPTPFAFNFKERFLPGGAPMQRD